MSVVPVLVVRRKKLLEHLENVKANSIGNAKSFDELLADWKYGLAVGLKRFSLEKDLKFLISRKKLAMTADGKYYLLLPV